MRVLLCFIEIPEVEGELWAILVNVEVHRAKDGVWMSLVMDISLSWRCRPKEGTDKFAQPVTSGWGVNPEVTLSCLIAMWKLSPALSR